MRRDKRREKALALLFGIVPVVWLALLLAPHLSEGLPGILMNFGSIMKQPFLIKLCGDSLKTVLAFLSVYSIAATVILSSEWNYRRREEHGSAKWGDARKLNRKYAGKENGTGKILTQQVSIGLDGRQHKRNLNVIVCGGSGSGKTRFYAKPNLLQANSSFVVLDPKMTVI